MAETQPGEPISAAVRAALAPAAGYLALVAASEPGSAEKFLARPDVTAVLTEALAEARDRAALAADAAWSVHGAPPGPVYSRLMADVARNFDALTHLRGLLRHAHAKGPESVGDAVLAWGRQAAMKTRMTVSAAETAGHTAAQLRDASEIGRAHV